MHVGVMQSMKAKLIKIHEEEYLVLKATSKKDSKFLKDAFDDLRLGRKKLAVAATKLGMELTLEMQETLKGRALLFAQANPRFMEYGIKFLHTAVKTQQGVDLSPTKLQEFMEHLTGSKVNLATIEEHLKTK